MYILLPKLLNKNKPLTDLSICLTDECLRIWPSDIRDDEFVCGISESRVVSPDFLLFGDVFPPLPDGMPSGVLGGVGGMLRRKRWVGGTRWVVAPHSPNALATEARSPEVTRFLPPASLGLD